MKHNHELGLWQIIDQHVRTTNPRHARQGRACQAVPTGRVIGVVNNKDPFIWKLDPSGIALVVSGDRTLNFNQVVQLVLVGKDTVCGLPVGLRKPLRRTVNPHTKATPEAGAGDSRGDIIDCYRL